MPLLRAKRVRRRDRIVPLTRRGLQRLPHDGIGARAASSIFTSLFASRQMTQSEARSSFFISSPDTVADESAFQVLGAFHTGRAKRHLIEA